MRNIISDLWSYQLSIVGVAVSVMTLLFASHVGKAEAYQHVSKNKDINSKNLSICLSNGIKAYKKLNWKIVRVLTFSVILFLYTSIVKYICNEDICFWLGILDIIFSIALSIWIVCVISKVNGQYKKDTKNNDE
mgnify:CR=1 FL=1